MSTSYYCEPCAFSCKKQSNYQAHLLTKKHQHKKLPFDAITYDGKSSPVIPRIPSQANATAYAAHPEHFTIGKYTDLRSKVEVLGKSNTPSPEVRESSSGIVERSLYEKNQPPRRRVSGVGKSLESISQPKIVCETCSRMYKDRSGLWRHRKKCRPISQGFAESNERSKSAIFKRDNVSYENPDLSEFPLIETQSKFLVDTTSSRHSNVDVDRENANSLSRNSTNLNEMIYDLVKQNQEIKELLLRQNEQLIQQSARSIVINHTHTTTNHAHISLNVFLQEKCKYAMNLTEFVDNLNVQTCDVEMVGRLGFVEGISRIILNGLSKMDIYTRPIHCTDIKRETIYIRNQNEWTRDTETKEHTKRAITRVANKNLNAISQWKQLHPETEVFDSDAYNMNMQILVQSLGGIGGTSSEKTERNQEKIWKRLMPEVVMDKQILTVK